MEQLKKILLYLRNVFTKKDDSVIPTDFSDLAPLDSIDNTSEYLNALDWALKNRRIRNVALCGPYGAGKSSIINSYLKSHADAQQKSLRISMATFIESKTEGSDSSHSFSLKPKSPRHPSLLGQMPGCIFLPYHSFTLGASGSVSVFAIVRALRFLDCESRCA